MVLEALLRPWAGIVVRHVPIRSPFDVLDFRLAGRAADNRWNFPGEPTLYLASDRGAALAEFARHLERDRSPELRRAAVERAVFRLRVEVAALLDLCDPRVPQLLALGEAPRCFLEKPVARATAHFIRRTTAAQGIRVPSMAFLDDPDRWNLVLFLEKLPADPRQFVTAAEPDGMFRVSGPETPSA